MVVPLKPKARPLWRALQGRHIVAGGNAPGRLTRKATHPERVVKVRAEAPSRVVRLFSFAPSVDGSEVRESH